MAFQLKRALATTGTVLALTAGGLLSGSPAASAAPCGLSGSYGPTAPHVKVHTASFTIRQCNGYTVKRRLDIDNGRDGKCYTIPAYSQISDSRTMPKFMFVRGMKPC